MTDREAIERLIVKPVTDAINSIFAFKFGETVKYKHEADYVGSVVERRLCDLGGDRLVPMYLVQWTAPKFAADSPPVSYRESELVKAEGQQPNEPVPSSASSAPLR